MENIIDRLLDIDRRARDLVAGASKQREDTIGNLSSVKKDLESSAMERARAAAEAHREQVREETARLKNAYAAEYEKNRAALESTYNAGCSNWVDTIVERCTKC